MDENKPTEHPAVEYGTPLFFLSSRDRDILAGPEGIPDEARFLLLLPAFS
jgi:hypothetical protein